MIVSAVLDDTSFLVYNSETESKYYKMRDSDEMDLNQDWTVTFAFEGFVPCTLVRCHLPPQAVSYNEVFLTVNSKLILWHRTDSMIRPRTKQLETDCSISVRSAFCLKTIKHF